MGYEDRFIGVIEKPFLELNWAEYSSLSHVEVAIPKHRIVFFKYRDAMVWDRRARVDNVFGSLGGMRIADAMRARDLAIAEAAAAAAEAPASDAEEEDADDRAAGRDVAALQAAARARSAAYAAAAPRARPRPACADDDLEFDGEL